MGIRYFRFQESWRFVRWPDQALPQMLRITGVRAAACSRLTSTTRLPTALLVPNSFRARYNMGNNFRFFHGAEGGHL